MQSTVQSRECIGPSTKSVGTVIAVACLGLVVALSGGCGESEEPVDDETAQIDEDEIDLDEPTGEIPPVRPPHRPFPPVPGPGSRSGGPVKILGPVEGAEMPVRAAPDVTPMDPSEALPLLLELYEVVRTPVGRFDVRANPQTTDSGRKARAKHVRALDGRKTDLDSFVNLGLRLFAHVGEGEADPVAHFLYGYGLAVRADRISGAEAVEHRRLAAKHLGRYLSRPDPDGEYVASAEYLRGTSLLKLGGQADDTGGDVIDDALGNLGRAVALFVAGGRNDEAGEAAFYVLQTLVAGGREREALKAAEEMKVQDTDLGVSTTNVRRLARRAALYVGGVMPEFPDVTDVDGKPLRPGDLRGKPVVVHFFQAGLPSGSPSTNRMVETVLSPLYDELHVRGLEMIGVSLDLELPSDRIAEIAANWDEWGREGKPHDGSEQTVRAWAVDNGLGWRLYWDGKWMNGAVASHYGVQASLAVLLDGEGIIRWVGTPPFQDLAETARTLVE